MPQPIEKRPVSNLSAREIQRRQVDANAEMGQLGFEIARLLGFTPIPNPTHSPGTSQEQRGLASTEYLRDYLRQVRDAIRDAAPPDPGTEADRDLAN